jgi:hypothetical protein
MARFHPRYGDSKLGCILWVALLLAFVGASWKIIPVKLRSSELYDFMEEQAMFAGRSKAETIKKRIVTRAEELDLPVKIKDIVVKRTGGRIRMKCTYVVPIEFPGYTYQWHFEHVVDRPVFVV